MYDSCKICNRRVRGEFPACVDVLYMPTNDRLITLKKACHLVCREPYGFVAEDGLHLRCAVCRLVDNDFASIGSICFCSRSICSVRVHWAYAWGGFGCCVECLQVSTVFRRELLQRDVNDLS